MARRKKNSERASKWHGVRPGDIFVHSKTSKATWLVVDAETPESPFSALAIGMNSFLGDCVTISHQNNIYVFQSVHLSMLEDIVTVRLTAYGQLFALGDDIVAMSIGGTFSLSGQPRPRPRKTQLVQLVKITLSDPKLVYTA